MFTVRAPHSTVPWCYNPGSSLCKRDDLQGKDGSTSVFRNLTKASAWTDAEDNVSGTRTGGFKGESLMIMAEAGAEDTGSDGYRRSNKEGSG